MTKEERDYLKNYMRRRYLILKVKAVEYKGGKCQKCNYSSCIAALIFHHRDPKEKRFGWKNIGIRC